jgi:hypothetical protein
MQAKEKSDLKERSPNQRHVDEATVQIKEGYKNEMQKAIS